MSAKNINYIEVFANLIKTIDIISNIIIVYNLINKNIYFLIKTVY